MKTFIGIDLGTTNLKAALYDADLRPVDSESFPVRYSGADGVVEFDADACFDRMLDLLEALLRRNGVTEVTALALTGQAETLVLLDKQGRALQEAPAGDVLAHDDPSFLWVASHVPHVEHIEVCPSLLLYTMPVGYVNRAMGSRF